MTDDKKVECATHGRSDPALVCGHLAAGGRNIGFVYSYPQDDPDALCPEAWCDACDDVLEREQGWTEAVWEYAGFKTVCASCFSRIRKDNWKQDEAAWERLVGECCEELSRKQRTLVSEFKLGEHGRYDYDQARAELVFSTEGKVAVTCDVAFVGGYSSKSGTWMWAWANTSNLEIVKARSREVRHFGEQQCFEPLAGAYWPAEPEVGWHMTGIAARLLDARGAYRVPTDYGHLYMVILDARWAS